MRNAYCNCDFLGCKMIGEYSTYHSMQECCFYGECQYQVAAQPQDTKERAENSPALPMQQAKHAEALREIVQRFEKEHRQWAKGNRSFDEFCDFCNEHVEQLRALQERWI